jgi:small conductance mechanosensitive channel
VTFPNSEVLRANVINYTRDFPYVWDEVDVGLTNESDLASAKGVLLEVAARILGQAMKGPITLYRDMLERASLDFDIAAPRPLSRVVPDRARVAGPSRKTAGR